MGIRKGTSAYEKLAKVFGELTFSSMLSAIADCDFDSRTECAKKLKMSPQALNDYLTGRRVPSATLAAKMADVLGYSPESFIELALTEAVKKAGFNCKVKLEKT